MRDAAILRLVCYFTRKEEISNFSVVNLADLNIKIIWEYAGEPKLITWALQNRKQASAEGKRCYRRKSQCWAEQGLHGMLMFENRGTRPPLHLLHITGIMHRGVTQPLHTEDTEMCEAYRIFKRFTVQITISVLSTQTSKTRFNCSQHKNLENMPTVLLSRFSPLTSSWEARSADLLLWALWQPVQRNQTSHTPQNLEW